jgi:hypothetical protein
MLIETVLAKIGLFGELLHTPLASSHWTFVKRFLRWVGWFVGQAALEVSDCQVDVEITRQR